MRKSIIIAAMCLLALASTATNPKREFRGAWLHTVHQSQYAAMTTEAAQKYLCRQLDSLQMTGCNAVVFQVRPSADAFYPSELEPWSRFLTGKAGQAPSPYWDPLQFMIEQSHARGMELHAWLNPYRVTTSAREQLPAGHIYQQHPERFVKYDGKLYFDPGIPENRAFIGAVVKDIVTRYDVDAIHMDDYFYPYPVAGKPFPDNDSFKKYSNGMKRNDWRRENVNLLIHELHDTIQATKPWVRLGISPFGIWRNKASDPKGSDTRGLQNYDDLYADVLLWTEKGWVDYMLPQLYWELEKKVASSEKLAYWWNDHANGRHMYFGQAIQKTMDTHDLAPSANPTQLDHKIALSRQLEHVQGNCWWPGYQLVKNYKGIADSLATNQQSTIALVPAYEWIDSIAPDEVKHLRCNDLQDGGKELEWNAPDSHNDPMQEAHAYVVYCFEKGEETDLNRSDAILAVTYEPHYLIPADMVRGKYKFIVTVLDRANNESLKGKAIKVKLND